MNSFAALEAEFGTRKDITSFSGFRVPASAFHGMTGLGTGYVPVSDFLRSWGQIYMHAVLSCPLQPLHISVRT